MNLIKFDPYRRSNYRWYVVPETHPELCQLFWSRQDTSVELGMILLLARRDELKFQCDDGKWSHLRLTRSHFGLQRRLVFQLVETLPSFSWSSSLRSWLFTGWSCLWEESLGSFPRNFAVPSANGNVKCSPFLDVNTSFALSLRTWNADASYFPHPLMSATIISTFQIPPATSAYPRNISCMPFLPNWWSFGWSFEESDDIQPLHRTEWPGL